MNSQSQILIKKMEQGFRSDIPSESKRRIIENSMTVFSKKGLTAARISDIAKEAGFSQGFVYNHYKSKDDIFNDISNLAASGSIRLVGEAAKLECGSFDKLYLLAQALTAPDTLAQVHFRLVVLQTAASDIIPDEAKESFKQAAREQIGIVAQIIADGQRTGDIGSGDAIEMAMAYFAVIQGIAIMRMQTEEEIIFPDLKVVLGFLKG